MLVDIYEAKFDLSNNFFKKLLNLLTIYIFSGSIKFSFLFPFISCNYALHTKKKKKKVSFLLKTFCLKTKNNPKRFCHLILFDVMFDCNCYSENKS